MKRLLLPLLLWLCLWPAFFSTPAAAQAAPCAIYQTIADTWVYRPDNEKSFFLTEETPVPVHRFEGNHAVMELNGVPYWFDARALNPVPRIVDRSRPSPVHPALLVEAPPAVVSYPVYLPAYNDGLALPPLPGDTYTGPRGGEYYYNGNDNRQYITPPATRERFDIQTGPRGGQFYINDNGRKTYIKH